MQKRKRTVESIDDYIRAFPRPARTRLAELRRIVREEAPEAREKISYRMPAFDLNGHLLYFAAYTKHIGFYPNVSCIRAFLNELAGYNTSKGTVQFPLDKPLPRGLLRRMVKFRVAEQKRKETR